MGASVSGISYRGVSEVQSELQPGESILWSGQPSRRVIFHSQDLFTVPFSLLWGGFALLWEFGVAAGSHGALHRNPPPFFVLWGIPFVVIGQYLIWGRFLYVAWKKGRTFYAVTTKRVLVLNLGLSRRVTDGLFRNLDSVSLTVRGNGVGTIAFAPDPYLLSPGPYFGRRRNGFQMDIDLSRFTFFDIEDVRQVHQLIQAQREQA